MKAESAMEEALLVEEERGLQGGRGRGQWARMQQVEEDEEAERIWMVKVEERHHQRRHEPRQKRESCRPTSQRPIPGPPLRGFYKPEVTTVSYMCCRCVEDGARL